MGSDNKPKILIVDDDDIIRETYVQVFAQNGFEVISARDGVEGIDKATKELPTVIMTGIVMPRMDGFQLISALRENTGTRDIPIAVFSHLGREEDRKKAKELGIDNFIVQGTATPKEIIGQMKNLARKDDSFEVKIDPYVWSAPDLARKIGAPEFNCPKCNQNMILELTLKKEGAGFDARFKCPGCDYSF